MEKATRTSFGESLDGLWRLGGPLISSHLLSPPVPFCPLLSCHIYCNVGVDACRRPRCASLRRAEKSSRPLCVASLAGTIPNERTGTGGRTGTGVARRDKTFPRVRNEPCPTRSLHSPLESCGAGPRRMRGSLALPVIGRRIFPSSRAGWGRAKSSAPRRCPGASGSCSRSQHRKKSPDVCNSRRFPSSTLRQPTVYI